MSNEPENNKNEKGEFLQTANILSLGIALVLCTLFGWVIGFYADKFFHTTPILSLVFLVLGIGAGFMNVFRTIRRIK